MKNTGETINKAIEIKAPINVVVKVFSDVPLWYCMKYDFLVLESGYF